jgi:predicted aspartyl protease
VPYFTRQVAPSGNLIVNAFIGVSQARRAALVAAGEAVPNPISIQGLIDTGANCLCVDPSVLGQLNLTPTGSGPVTTPTTGAQPATADQYDVSIVIPLSASTAPFVQHTIAAVSAELLGAQGFHAIIGLSVLQHCLVTYDGKNGLFSIAF